MEVEQQPKSKSQDEKHSQEHLPNEDRRTSLADSVIGPDALNAGQSYDSSISFEEYLYWAQQTRSDEQYERSLHDESAFGPDTQRRRFLNFDALRLWASSGKKESRSSRDSTTGIMKEVGKRASASDRITPERPERNVESSPHHRDQRHIPILDEEWIRASRAVRTASWSAVFYLLTMDILGPFSVPWAFAAVSTNVPNGVFCI